jgi:hypothetical protein
MLLDRIRQEISQDDYYRQNFPNDGQRFLAWYLRNVYLRSKVQAKQDITDGSNDKEIDAVIVDDEKRQVIIIQSKFFSSTVDHEPLHEVLAAWMQIKNLPKLQENANQKVMVKLAEISEALNDEYDVVFELVTTGDLTEAARRDLASFQETLGEMEEPQATLILVDREVIEARLNDAMSVELPKLSYTLTLEPGKYVSMGISNYRTVIAAVKLSDCIHLPGIRDGSLFRKNVRQSLGLTNKVNKGLKQTIQGDSPQYFFLFHNGVTALCDRLTVNEEEHSLSLEGLSVVNGCQSLNTILACSEKAKTAKDAYILFRFYEIPQRDLADRISINTNSQSAVKPRDLRSNDKRVLALKRAFENQYPDGYFITKRGEDRPADRKVERTVDISVLAKLLMTWHCQRPNVANNENRLFDKHFEQLFRADYPAADILALHQWAMHIERRWKQNDLGLNEVLVAAPSYAKHHLLFAVQSCFATASGQTDKVPFPSSTGHVTTATDKADAVLVMAANCFNSALDGALIEAQEKDRIFSPQNWLKAKDSFLKIQATVKMYVSMLGNLPGGADLKKTLTIPADKFGLRWSAE